MADLAQLERALIKADAAGDADAARVFAGEIRRMRSASVGADATPTETSLAQHAGNLGAGALRGATSIGSTVLAPFKAAWDGTGQTGAQQERKSLIANAESGLRDMGAQPDSMMYQGGKLGAEIAGTAGVGGALAKGAQAAGTAPKVINALQSGGFSLGTPAAATRLGQVGDAALRVGSGAAVGGASAGAINPSEAGFGAMIGGAFPVAGAAGGVAGNALNKATDWTSKKLMNSALKPTIAMHRTGAAQAAVQTLLDHGINVTKGGVEKLRSLIDDIDTQVSDKIANSTATVSKQKALNTLDDVRSQFAKQVDPTPDLNAIQGVADRFAQHPSLPSDAIPVQLAQELKQGTYSVLKKKYGQMGSADVEAQKGLARGLKEGIADAVPEVAGLNAQEAKLLKALDVTERRAFMNLNNNPMGIAGIAALVDPRAWAVMMADKSDLFKSLAARAINSSGSGMNSMNQGLLGVMQSPVARTGLLTYETSP